MNQIMEQHVVDIMLSAYELGAFCQREVNSGREWTKKKGEAERKALDALLTNIGAAKLSDDDYLKFCQ